MGLGGTAIPGVEVWNFPDTIDRTLGHPANLDVQSLVFSQNCKSQECLVRSAIFYSAMLAVVMAARSGEFDAATQLLNRGAKLHGLVLAPPDCGPESETDRPRDA